VQSFTPQIFGFVCLSAVFDDVVADYLWARSVLLTSPTVATVGLSLTIPLAILTDMFSSVVHGGDVEAPSAASLGGAALVIAGFVLVNVGMDTLTNFMERLRDERNAVTVADSAAVK
jgi:solute carrier family 35 protein F5